MSDDANDVTKALAAFGAPSIRYHSFGQAVNLAQSQAVNFVSCSCKQIHFKLSTFACYKQQSA